MSNPTDGGLNVRWDKGGWQFGKVAGRKSWAQGVVVLDVVPGPPCAMARPIWQTATRGLRRNAGAARDGGPKRRTIFSPAHPATLYAAVYRRKNGSEDRI